MQELGRMQILVAQTPCPECSETCLDLTLRCDMTFGECLYTARCGACSTAYAVSRSDELCPLDDVACPECATGHMRPTMVCESDTHSCHEIQSCTECGAVRTQELVR